MELSNALLAAGRQSVMFLHPSGRRLARRITPNDYQQTQED